jgi:hypothetical protein
MATIDHLHMADRYSPCEACVDMVPELRAERHKYEAEQKAQALVKELTRFVNGMSREESDAFSTALANDHPTLIGQVAKAVGIGVMRRVMYDPEWKAYDDTIADRRQCAQRWVFVNVGATGPKGIEVPHTEHDGRLSCETVIGAELMARQGFI